MCVKRRVISDANSAKSTSCPYSTQIMSPIFASRPVASDQSPTQMGVLGPTLIIDFVVVMHEDSNSTMIIFLDALFRRDSTLDNMYEKTDFYNLQLNLKD